MKNDPLYPSSPREGPSFFMKLTGVGLVVLLVVSQAQKIFRPTDGSTDVAPAVKAPENDNSENATNPEFPTRLDSNGFIGPGQDVEEGRGGAGDEDPADGNPELTPMEAEEAIENLEHPEAPPKEPWPEDTKEPVHRELKKTEPKKEIPPRRRSAPSLEPLFVEGGVA